MKITCKPNQNSMFHLSVSGETRWNMVDLMIGDEVWTSVHVDFFPDRSVAYEALYKRGETVELELSEVTVKGGAA